MEKATEIFKKHWSKATGRLLDDWTKHKMQYAIDAINEALDINNIIATKPPLGIIPKKINDELVKLERLNELSNAIARYYEAGLKINPDWITEYNDLVDSIDKNCFK